MTSELERRLSAATDRPRMTTRDRALALAASIVETRAAEIEHTYRRWLEKYPSDTLGAATERAAFMECQFVARLIRERMSPAGVRALATNPQSEKEPTNG